ncbi:hypothetical protein JYU09_00550 [bacterium AH-315-O15]|nr:hypothetical protein [bacterium AH-315-O15]
MFCLLRNPPELALRLIWIDLSRQSRTEHFAPAILERVFGFQFSLVTIPRWRGYIEEMHEVAPVFAVALQALFSPLTIIGLHKLFAQDSKREMFLRCSGPPLKVSHCGQS